MRPTSSSILPRLLVLAAFLGPMTGSPAVEGQEADATSILHGVLFEGHEGLSREDLLERSGLVIGQRVSEQDVARAVERLVASRRIETVEVLPALRDADGFTLRLRVSVHPVLDRVEFVLGPGHPPLRPDLALVFTAGELGPVDLLEKLEVHPGQVLDPATRIEAIALLEAWYRRQGHPFPHIVEKLEPAPPLPGRVVWRLEIDEGPEVYLRDVIFHGNRALSDRELTAVLGNRPRELLGLFSPGEYDPTRYEEDLERIRDLYRRHGYLDVRVAHEGFRLDYRRGALTLEVRIVEGPRFELKGIEIRGNRPILDEVLGRQIRTPFPAPYDGHRLEADRARLLLYYMNRTFRSPHIELEHLYPLSPRPEVTAVFDVDENRHLYLGQILIEGNTFTRDRVILSAIPLAPLDPVTPLQVARLAERIRALGHFEEVTVETRAAPDRLSPFLDDPDADPRTRPGAVRDLVVKVKEKPRGLFEVGGGASSGRGEIFSIIITQPNFDWLDWPGGERGWKHPFSGGGQMLRAQILPGTRVSEFNLFFEEPYLGNTRNSLSVEVSNQLFRWREFEENHLGGEIGWRHRLDARGRFSTRLGLRLEDVQIDRIDPGVPAQIRDLAGHTRLAYPSFKIGFDDTLSNEYVGLTGIRATTRVDLSLEELGTEARFVRTIGQVDLAATATQLGNWLLPGEPLSTDFPDLEHRLKLGLRAGWMEGLQGDEVPFFERFRLGGPRTFRGFSHHDVGPREGDIPVGGEAFWTATLEYTFPLYWRELRLGVLADVGDVATEFSKLGSGRIRTSAGVSLHARLKIFGLRLPASLYFVEVLRKERDDEERFFSFTLGYEF